MANKEKSKSIKEIAQENELNTKKTFALTYRPKLLKDLCGHDSVVNQLKGMIKERDVPNALMLVGGSGVGKTTLARMITRYLNCETFEGCGKCSSCKLIDADSHPDLAEINSGEIGIDEAKGLVQKSMYKPRFRLRVIFLDEVHLLPQKTMQVLLKPLEEPPSHTMWILATTNPEKIANTAAVCGRCTPLVLNPPTKEQMATRLAQVCKKEGLKFDEEILLQIAEQSGGHVRDSLQLLESISRYVKGLDGKVKGSELKKAIQEQALKNTTQEVDRVAMKVLLSVYNNNLKGVVGSLLDTKEYVPLVNAMLQLNQYVMNTESVSKHPTIWHNAQCTAFKSLVSKKYDIPSLTRMCQIHSVLNQLRNDIVTTQVSGSYLICAGLGGLCNPKKLRKPNKED